jgi:hypothetical protein
VSDLKGLLDEAQQHWQAASADSWLQLFTPDAKFFVPGATAVSGDHTAEQFRTVVPRLMRAHGDESGLWVIDTYLSAQGAVVLADQKVLRDGDTHHYHAMMLYEIGPNATDRFAFWWLMVHEYDAFERAWK